ncbi:putative manganese efflux pump MntP [Kroppenstedtia guangzhouensis]|uniref:Putative manganese efflux pump MntP n=1 Tax=Kroppenstedtia guangzhouensis TaxID=1274356 RepID=A0ABQ1GKZ6_9BACL|nr:manganese efflux pump [Kroppenstedtia guangzhouensis]GGA45916.1 putative manganese efflux pump MntP [Kroppenstedtia guangzhouensis]
MDFSLPLWGQFFTLWMISVALGMDAFSLGIGVGMQGLRFRRILLISGMIGVFHILMPLVGFTVGRFLGSLVEEIAVMVGGGLLCLLGTNMLMNAFHVTGEEESPLHDSLWGLLLLSFSVSLDSLSAGLSLGFFAADLLLAVLLFGTTGGVMACTGMLLGRRARSWIGDYGEAVGGLILISFGLRFLL